MPTISRAGALPPWLRDCCATLCVAVMQDTVQTVQALKGASSQMRVAMKQNKELDLNFIDNLQVCKEGAAGVRTVCMSCGCWQQAAGIPVAFVL